MEIQTVKPIFDKIIVTDQKPAELYSMYLAAKPSEWPVAYLSSALTNGGFWRISQEDSFMKNAFLARDIITALYQHNLLDPTELIFFPGDTTSPGNWGQFEYNLFFSLFIIGVESPEDAIALADYVDSKIDKTGFDKTQPLDIRKRSYDQLAALVVEFVNLNSIKHTPVKRIIELVDTEMSLGATMESMIAKSLGAKDFRVQFNTAVQTGDEILQSIFERIREIRKADETFTFFGDDTGDVISLKAVEQ